MTQISAPALQQGLKQLSDLRKLEYGDGLDWSFRRPYFDDNELWRTARMAGILMKAQFAIRKEIGTEDPRSVTGARFRYDYKPTKVMEASGFEKSWQYQIFEAIRESPLGIDKGSAAETAVWLGGERKTMTYVIRLLRPFICKDEKDEVASLIDDLFDQGVKLGVQGGPALILANWLVFNLPFLAHASPVYVAAIVVILGRTGTRRFCAWSKELQSNDDAGRPAEP